MSDLLTLDVHDEYEQLLLRAIIAVCELKPHCREDLLKQLTIMLERHNHPPRVLTMPSLKDVS